MTMRIVQEEEVIDLVAMFKATRARLRAALVACLLMPLLALGVVALHPSVLAVWVAVASGGLGTLGVRHVLARLRDVNQLIANPYWQQIGVRSWIQQRIDERRGHHNNSLIVRGGK